MVAQLVQHGVNPAMSNSKVTLFCSTHVLRAQGHPGQPLTSPALPSLVPKCTHLLPASPWSVLPLSWLLFLLLSLCLVLTPIYPLRRRFHVQEADPKGRARSLSGAHCAFWSPWSWQVEV